ncbi:sigma-70 family RNA polymerase sigma factor [Cellulosilyticum sp. I15G10I2]|uniref:sigma-70 family RNA polymerase sigma factor n=1 Tax=Cellulosilyticum sp. I15G10I2 TaxID=1892843 RepID=UPI00085CBBFA|nr:sigma-70 family RNA polymerase sigma factor [Cellulosilyticum sp. I15G10I2]
MEEVAIQGCLNQCEVREQELTYLFETYYKRVYNCIYYRVHCQYVSEDLTSQVFEKIMLKLHTYKEERSNFEVWLFAIVRNVVNDYFRSKKKHQWISIDSILHLKSASKEPEALIISRETSSELLEAIKVLEENERHLIAYKFGASLKNKEIAQILGMSESNVGVKLYRIMKKLKTKLEGEDE